MYGMTSGRCGRAHKASVLRGEAFLVGGGGMSRPDTIDCAVVAR
jgi:hypothetical protein